MIGEMTKTKGNPANEFQSLDALLLLRNTSLHIESSREVQQYASLDKSAKNNRTNYRNASSKPIFNRSASDRLSGGFDNVAFDLGALEEAGPGCRKPLISVHLRTVSPEEYVLSSLNKQPLTSKYVQNTVLSLDSKQLSAIRRGVNFKGQVTSPSTDDANLRNYVNKEAKVHPLIFANDRILTAINGQQPHSMPTHINITSSPLKQPYSHSPENINHFHSLPPYLSSLDHSGNESSGCSPCNVANDNFFANSSDDDNISVRSQHKADYEFNTATKIRLKDVNNAEYINSNENGEIRFRKLKSEENDQLNIVRLNERESENNSNSVLNSVTSNEREKMETVQVKKTEVGSFELTNTKQVLSSRETMVQIGGVSGLSPPNIQNVQVTLPSKTSVKSIDSRTKNSNVSQISVMSNLSVSNRVSNVVISSGGVCVAPTSVPTVSALSKVSSVRIVPSPVTTPTPSVIGGTSDTSSISSQTRSRPLSLVRQNKINLRNTTIPPRHPNVALLHSSVHQVLAGRPHSLDPNIRRESDPNRVQANLSTPLPLPPTTAGLSDRGASRKSSNSEALSISTQNAKPTLPVSDVLLDKRGSQSTAVVASVRNSNNVSGDPLSHNVTTEASNSQSTNFTASQNNNSTADNSGTCRQTSDADPVNGNQANSSTPSGGLLEGPRRQGRERRRERRERRRERRALRNSGVPASNPPQGGGQTEVSLDPQPPMPIHPPHLPDLLNSHVPPPYSTLPNGPRSLGCLMGHPHNVNVGHPPPMSLQMPPPPPPPGPPMGSLGPYPPPGPLPHGPPLRPPPPENPWHFFGSRRSRGSPRCAPYISDEEAKSCCGLLVTQAVSIRWFIIMIAFVGLCCTVVGTVLGAVKTNSSEYVTITLLMIGVGIVLITVSGVAWHLTSRDAPCRVMLGLAPSGRGETRNRFMARMAPTFGRPHHPYAAMMYPEFQYRPPPPSYQASMQEYRLRLLLLDRQGGHHGPPLQNVPSPPPIYRHPTFSGRMLLNGTLAQESEYSRPPSYRSMEGSVVHHPDAPASVHPGVGTLPNSHSRDPSCLSFLSHDSLYSSTTPGSMEGSTTRRGRNNANKISIVGCSDGYEPNKYPVVESLENPSTSNKKISSVKDDNTVTIVQTTVCSHVIGSDSVLVTVPTNEPQNGQNQHRRQSDTEISVLAHL